MRPLPSGFIPSPDRTYTVPYAGTMNSSQDTGVWSPPWRRGLNILSPPSAFSCNTDNDIRFIRMTPKSSADIVDYSVDFSEALEDTGDTILTVIPKVLSVAQSPYDLTVMYVGVYENTTASIIVASGIPSSLQEVDIQIQTKQGRVLNKQIRIWINTLTPATPAPSLIPTLPADAILDGRCFLTQQSPLNAPLFTNGGVIMTYEDDVIPTGTLCNGGVLISNPIAA